MLETGEYITCIKDAYMSDGNGKPYGKPYALAGKLYKISDGDGTGWIEFIDEKGDHHGQNFAHSKGMCHSKKHFIPERCRLLTADDFEKHMVVKCIKTNLVGFDYNTWYVVNATSTNFVQINESAIYTFRKTQAPKLFVGHYIGFKTIKVY